MLSEERANPIRAKLRATAGRTLASAEYCDDEERGGAGRERDDEELKPREDDERNGAERLE